MRRSILLCVLCVLSVRSSASRVNEAEVKLFEAPAQYALETTVLLNEAARADREVGYKLTGALAVAAVAAAAAAPGAPRRDLLLRFQLIKSQLQLRGKHPNANFMVHKSVWDEYPDTTFYAHWKNGLIQNSYLDLQEDPDVINYKKSLISLFQFQIIDGDFNETDISGSCEITYESISEDEFRKIKRRCAGDEGVSARRLTRYTLAAGALQALFADELLTLARGELGVKARSWHRLQAAPVAPAPAAPAAALPALADALAALPPRLAPATLDLIDTKLNAEHDQKPLEELIEEHRAALQGEEAGAGGDEAAAAAALRLVPALRAAPAAALAALLRRGGQEPLLPGLCALLGASGGGGAAAAAEALLAAGAGDAPAPLAARYLAGLALAARPHAGAVAAAARLARGAALPAVAHAALLAAAAAAPRVQDRALALDLYDYIMKALPKCKEEEACVARHAAALGALGRAAAAPKLLALAERGRRASALAALDALDALHERDARDEHDEHDAHHAHHAHAARPPAVLHYARRLRLERIALLSNCSLEVRATALDLFVRSSAARPLPLVATARALSGPAAPSELRRVFWGRLRELAAAHRHVADTVKAMPVDIVNWDTMAMKGTSSVLARRAGWAAGGAAARLSSLQLAAGGLLRRGTVALHAERDEHAQDEHDEHAQHARAPLASVRLWTRGMRDMAPAAADDAVVERDEDDGMSAGLELSVGGAPLPGVVLFEGQAQLLALVWAGAGSEPTPVLRALWAPLTAGARRPLQAGVAAALTLRSGAALALDAAAQVSLWARTARATLHLRAALAAEAGAHVRTRWGALSALARSSLAPRLGIDADLDFYDVVALCVRAHSPPHRQMYESHLQSVQGGRSLNVTRVRTSAHARAGRTLSLGAANDRACAHLAPPPAAH